MLISTPLFFRLRRQWARHEERGIEMTLKKNGKRGNWSNIFQEFVVWLSGQLQREFQIVQNEETRYGQPISTCLHRYQFQDG
jgi:hypothetical protein